MNTDEAYSHLSPDYRRRPCPICGTTMQRKDYILVKPPAKTEYVCPRKHEPPEVWKELTNE